MGEVFGFVGACGELDEGELEGLLERGGRHYRGSIEGACSNKNNWSRLCRFSMQPSSQFASEPIREESIDECNNLNAKPSNLELASGVNLEILPRNLILSLSIVQHLILSNRRRPKSPLSIFSRLIYPVETVARSVNSKLCQSHWWHISTSNPNIMWQKISPSS